MLEREREIRRQKKKRGKRDDASGDASTKRRKEKNYVKCM